MGVCPSGLLKNVILFTNIFVVKVLQYNEHLVSPVDTDGLVLKHQGISSHSADYIPSMHFQVFMD